MRIQRRMVAGVVTGFLVSTTCVPVFAGSQDDQIPQAISVVTIPCEPLSWADSTKLPWFFPPQQVDCVSPTLDKLRASAEGQRVFAEASRSNAYGPGDIRFGR